MHADDSPRRQILTGQPAAVVREQIVRTTVGALRLAVRHPGAAAPHPRRELTLATDLVATMVAQPIQGPAGAVQAAPSPASAHRSPGTGYGA
jgi:hypothetical protein